MSKWFPLFGLTIIVVRALVAFGMCAPFFTLDHLQTKTKDDSTLEVLYASCAAGVIALFFAILNNVPSRADMVNMKDEDLSKTEREIKNMWVNFSFPDIDKDDMWLFFLPVMLALLPIVLGFIGTVPSVLRCILLKEYFKLVGFVVTWILVTASSLAAAMVACMLVLVKRSQVEEIVEKKNLKGKKKIQ